MSGFGIDLLTCFTDVGSGIIVVASLLQWSRSSWVVSLVAAVFVIAIDKLRGATGAVAVATCAASLG